MLAACVALCGGAVQADPGYYVVTAYSNPGRKTVDYRYWTVESKGSPVVQWPELGLGWNVNSRWYSEVLVSYIRSSQIPNHVSSRNWQNDILLTQGEYPFDLALHTLASVPTHAGGGWTLEFGPALQTDIDRTQLNANLFFERGFGSFSSQGTQLKYQWQVRHRWQPRLHIGAQGFGELGQWDRWLPQARQSHRLGPALFGTVHGPSGDLDWQLAYLAGKTYGQRGNMLSARVAYSF